MIVAQARSVMHGTSVAWIISAEHQASAVSPVSTGGAAARLVHAPVRSSWLVQCGGSTLIATWNREVLSWNMLGGCLPPLGSWGPGDLRCWPICWQFICEASNRHTRLRKSTQTHTIHFGHRPLTCFSVHANPASVSRPFSQLRGGCCSSEVAFVGIR